MYEFYIEFGKLFLKEHLSFCRCISAVGVKYWYFQILDLIILDTGDGRIMLVQKQTRFHSYEW